MKRIVRTVATIKRIEEIREEWYEELENDKQEIDLSTDCV